LAGRLWQSGIFEARILAGMVDRPEWVTVEQIDAWIKDFDNWAICDSTCMRLFSRLGTLAHKKVREYARSEKEYVRRAAFALIASLVVHDKKSGDDVFIKYLPLIKKYSTDERNYVRKAVNWALRQIGKRNLKLNKAAIALAGEILKVNSKTARWIAADALRELSSEAVLKRLKNKK
jgi:3-methyladenine DNA glycosylase AlkD